MTSSFLTTLQLVLKRLARSNRTLLAFAAACLIIYLLFSASGGSRSSRGDQGGNQETQLGDDENVLDARLVKKQMANFENRLDRLQKTLDRTKQDADELRSLLKKASFDMKLISLAKGHSPEIVESPPPNAQERPRIAVLVMACNRPNAIEDHLKLLIQRRGDRAEQFPIVVSQDCNHDPTLKAIEKFKTSLFAIVKQPDQNEIMRTAGGQEIARHLQGYYKISRHYKWALDQAFVKFGFESVIITEDDLNIAVDFFDYFEAMQSVLARDSKSLMCVSAWNDNGKENFIDMNRPEMVHRTDFFPGLGWMLLKSMWLELRDKWPASYWDDWMRESAQRKNRSCLRPEISRTGFTNHGKAGVSLGLFFDTYLRLIVTNNKPVDWKKINTDYLIKENYDLLFQREVYDDTSVSELRLEQFIEHQKQADASPAPVRIVYSDQNELARLTKHFGIMSDLRNGVPRTSYLGVIRIVVDKSKQVVYLVPHQKKAWTGYNPSWN